MKTILSSLVLSALCLLLAAGDEITFTRLKGPPDAITEEFFGVKKGREIVINGEVIQKIHLQIEEGKSHARMNVFYENTGSTTVSPNYIIRLYNPYGMLMGGIQVPLDGKTPETAIDPGGKSLKTLMPGMTRMDSLFRHADIKEYPSDFNRVRWLSISYNNTIPQDADAEQAAPTPGAEPEGSKNPQPKK